MFGKIELIHCVVIGVAAVTIATDLIWGKIFNFFTASVALSGFLVSTYSLGWEGAGQSVLGIFAGLVLYGWMFGLRFMGGGDVKLLMALGAWGGWQYTAEVAILGVLLGGVFSLLILVVTGRLLNFIKKMYFFALSLFIKELEIQLPKVDKTLTMPFGVPLSIAAVWTVFAHPLLAWGIKLWP